MKSPCAFRLSKTTATQDAAYNDCSSVPADILIFSSDFRNVILGHQSAGGLYTEFIPGTFLRFTSKRLFLCFYEERVLPTNMAALGDSLQPYVLCFPEKN